MQRRDFLASALVAAAAPLAACGNTAPEAASRPAAAATTAPARSRLLVAYFSRPGENYWHGGRKHLKVGNTERVARHIRRRTSCDLFEIRAADAYPDDYEETVARNSREQDDDARPAIAGQLPRLEGYRTVILASPIWNVRPPMIMATFTEALDFAGKTVLPLTTHAMSGMGTAVEDYRRLCPGARLGRGLAIQGEKAATAAARHDIDVWLRARRLT